MPGGTLKFLKKEGFEYVVSGDIFLEDLKKYREQFLERFDLKGLFPLWQKNTRKQIGDFNSAGFETLICCTNSKYLGEDWLGRKLDNKFLLNLPEDIDPCGENGEFHTFCFNGPIFQYPVSYLLGNKEYKPLQIKTTEGEAEFGFWYLDTT